MLRLAEFECKEYKDTMRYLEIQLVRQKEQTSDVTKKYEEAQTDISNLHEQIGRQSNIAHAYTSQMEEMSKRLQDVDSAQKAIHDKYKEKLKTYETEVDMREKEINRIKKMLEIRDEDCDVLLKNLKMREEQVADLTESLELKSAESNRLRKQVAEVEEAMKDLYVSRKQPGSLQMEMDSLKADNEHLLGLLRLTSEYANCEDQEIMKSAKTVAMDGLKGLKASFEANKRARGVSGEAIKAQKEASRTANKFEADWIPTEAVKALDKIRDNYEGKLNEISMSRILYELNTIWRNIMRKDQDALKCRLNAQIQDLRRQLIETEVYDKGELLREVHKTKRQLVFAQKSVQAQAAGKENDTESAVSQQPSSKSSRRSSRVGTRSRH